MKLFLVQADAATIQVAHEQVAERMRKESANIQASNEQQVMAPKIKLEQTQRQANGVSTSAGPKRGNENHSVVFTEAMKIIENAMH